MTLQKPDLRILTVWRIRLLVTAVAPSAVTAYFSINRTWAWWLFSASWIAAFLYFYIGYYPIKYRKLSYSLNQTCLVVHCGVIYTRIKAMPLVSIQYVSVSSTPLQQLFGLCSLVVYAAGSTLRLPGLPLQDGILLQGALTPDGGSHG